MPFNELQRSDSWPPTVMRLHPDEPEDMTAAMDENPFAYFLTSPEDMDEYLDDEDLSAGIETPDAGKSPVREVSLSSLQRTNDNAEKGNHYKDTADLGVAMPLTLRELTTRHSSGRESRAGKRSDDHLKGLGIALPARGRAKVRLIPSGSGRGRGQTRSLSARRPQSWREPSPDIWSIEEEDEGEEDQAGAKGMQNLDMPLSQSAPPTLKIGMGEMVKPKPKKRVHWAF